MSAFCPRCGSATGPRDRFCKRCGGNLQTLRSKLGAGPGTIPPPSRVAGAAAARPTVAAAMASMGGPAPARPSPPRPLAAKPPPPPAPAPPAAAAAAPPPAAPAPRPASRIAIPDSSEPAADEEDLFAGMVQRPATAQAPAPVAARTPVASPPSLDISEPLAEDEPPDLPPLKPGVAPAAPKMAAPPPAPPAPKKAAAPPPKPAAASPAPKPAPPAPAPEPAAAQAPAASPGDSLNFFDLESSLGGHSSADVDFSSLSSPALAADEGASFYDLDALSSSGAPVPAAEGGEAVYDLDSFFSGSGPVAAAKAPGQKGPAKSEPKQELVDFSALSSSEPSAYDLDSLSLLGGTDPFASLLVPTQGKPAAGIAPAEVSDMESELARAAQPAAGVRKPAAGSMCLVVYQDNRAVNYHLLGQDETFLGKDEEGENTFPGLDLSRFDPTGAISPLHASIVCEGNKYFIQDIPQSTGTKVNGSLLPKGQKVPLKDGDSLLLGNKVLLRFEVTK